VVRVHATRKCAEGEADIRTDGESPTHNKPQQLLCFAYMPTQSREQQQSSVPVISVVVPVFSPVIR